MSNEEQNQVASTKPTRVKKKKMEVMVAERIQETHDAVTLVLFTGNDVLDYKPGHFITIDPHQFSSLERWTSYLENTKGGKEKARAYSLYSAPHEKYLAFTIKEERYEPGKTMYPPLLSPVLVNRVRVGDRMEITGFTGPYTLPDDIEDKTDHLVHITAGSGSVPNLSMLKHALHNNLALKHTFIYSNKYWRDVIYAKQLGELAEQYPDKLKVVHALTRDDDFSAKQFTGPNHAYHKGRVSADLIKQHGDDLSAAHFFVCGPGITKWDKKKAKAAGETPSPRFLESVLSAVEDLGVDKKQLHNESYG